LAYGNLPLARTAVNLNIFDASVLHYRRPTATNRIPQD
jgi:hypothetical protein